jgi:hypothetical protein
MEFVKMRASVQMVHVERPVRSGNYRRPPRELPRYVDDHVETLLAKHH